MSTADQKLQLKRYRSSLRFSWRLNLWNSVDQNCRVVNKRQNRLRQVLLAEDMLLWIQKTEALNPEVWFLKRPLELKEQNEVRCYQKTLGVTAAC